MKKIVIIISMIFLIVGCGTNKEISNAYKKMEIGQDKINGYTLDLRIYGTVNNENTNKIVRIENYNNTEKEIRIVNTSITEKERPKDTIIYVKDNKTYISDTNGNYIETTEKQLYTNPNIYLEGLKNIKKNSKAKEEKVGDIVYQIYEVTISKKIVTDILNEIGITESVKKDVKGSVYLDSNGYVNRVIYELDNLTINANYFGINTSREIIVPKTINQ